MIFFERRSLVWRPLQIALMVSVLSVDWTKAEVSFSTSPKPFEGRRCCGVNEVFSDNGCVSVGSAAVDFAPSVYFSNDSDATSLGMVEWRVKPLDCTTSVRMKLEYHNVDGNETRLELIDDKVILRWRELVFKRTEDYCVGQHQQDGGYEAVICRVDIEEVCSGATCVQKCCGENETISITRKTCIRDPGKDDLYDFRSLGGGAVSVPDDLIMVNRIPICQPLNMLNPRKDALQEYYLLQNGQLYEEDTGTRHDINRYCLEHVQEIGPIAFVCRDPPPRALEVKKHLQAAGVLISSIFLIVTIVCHLVIPQIRNVQGLCLMAHMTSLLVVDCTLLSSYMFTNRLSDVHCVINGILLQLSFLATFFWLNVMCFDIWRVIRDTVHLIPLTGILSKDDKKFKLYSIYAWGCPLVITTVSIIIHYLPDHPNVGDVLRPGFGVERCWISGDLSLFVHYYLFVGILFVLNILLIGHTIFMLHRAGHAFLCSRHTSVTGFNRHHIQAFWQRFFLFTLMAACWITEILSWKIPPKEIWIITDVLNSLQGFFVFAIFISSKTKREMTRSRLQNSVTSFRRVTSRLTRTEPLTSAPQWHVSDSAVTEPTDVSPDNQSVNTIPAKENRTPSPETVN